MNRNEQITRFAKTFGNGAHVFVPKKWVGEQILLVKPKKKSFKEKILQVLASHLDSIMGVYLYGSFSRGEQAEDSDIDLFVITSKKIKIKEVGFEIISLEKKHIEKTIKLEPLLMYSIFAEAKPIINSKILEDLRSIYKPKISDFYEFFKNCRIMLKINKRFLDLENENYTSNGAVIYSLILRLRGLFIVRCLLRGNIYSHKSFRNWISQNVKDIDFDLIYQAYKNAKNDLKIKTKVKTRDLGLLLDFLRNELEKFKKK